MLQLNRKKSTKSRRRPRDRGRQHRRGRGQGQRRRRASSATAIAPLPPGAFDDGEVIDSDAVAETLRATFSENGLSKRVRLGIANQRVVVRTMQLAGDRGPRRAGRGRPLRRPRSRSRCRSTRRFSTIASSAASPPTEDAPPQIDVVVVAARRDMIAASLTADPRRRPRAGGRRPLGLRHDPRPRRAEPALLGDEVSRSAGDGPLLQHRRRHQSRRRQGALLPLHPRRPGRPRGIATELAERHRPGPGARTPLARPTSAWRSRSRRSRATRS